MALLLFMLAVTTAAAQKQNPQLQYTLSIPRPGSHTYEVSLQVSRWSGDSIILKMPRWMPGYYQIIDYAGTVQHLEATTRGRPLPIKKPQDNTWIITATKNKPLTVSYSIKTTKQFVANSYVDSARAYLAPANTFLYIEGHLDLPVAVNIVPNGKWTQIATGLDPVPGKSQAFTAPGFDILYDCPILIGNLESLPPFEVRGIGHRFIGYQLGDFDRTAFMDKLKKIVTAAADIIGDIPYRQYTFIGIGPGRGGIEHLNNTTVAFDGSGLQQPGAMNRMLNFLAHEYFHHYNVKRIRPFELGPFDYEKGNRTNLLWVSEGLTVYYEYLVVKRAGLSDAATLLANLSGNITAVENNPGRHFQSLQGASYSTWSDGPFGTQGKEPGKSISYYDKGPVVGMLLDFQIRQATQNKASLDDVMRLLYDTYYRKAERGFTEAEFQEACEAVAGISLSRFFEYVYTTKEIDYAKYLDYAGLKLKKETTGANDKKTEKFTISRIENPTPLQAAIWHSWAGE